MGRKIVLVQCTNVTILESGKEGKATTILPAESPIEVQNYQK